MLCILECTQAITKDFTISKFCLHTTSLWQLLLLQHMHFCICICTLRSLLAVYTCVCTHCLYMYSTCHSSCMCSITQSCSILVLCLIHALSISHVHMYMLFLTSSSTIVTVSRYCSVILLLMLCILYCSSVIQVLYLVC
jgi:hypothetical protein